MKTEQVNIRLEPDLLAALERVAREESLDRGIVIRRLLERSIEQWELERAVREYQSGEMSLGRAAEEAGITQWELLDLVRTAGVAYPLSGRNVEERLHELFPKGHRSCEEWLGQSIETLEDIPPQPGGILLVGINPAPVSVAAGHYYQGRIGTRLWRRLERLGLLVDPEPGAEDDAFARSGHGLTDLVKRPSTSSREVSRDELAAGVESLIAKVRAWKPGMILFAFAEPGRQLLGASTRPGRGSDFEGARTFLLSGPYASAEETQRIDHELLNTLGGTAEQSSTQAAQSQVITENDLARGQVRLPSDGKRFFPAERSDVEVIVRGRRVACFYDPRLGPDRERSAVLRVGGVLRELVAPGERLRVSRGLGGVPQLD